MNELNLNEEIIDGHLVTRDVKKIWIIELNIYKEFKRICDKYNLRYCAYAGTLLGIVRHNGCFIPWDDDIDICMPFEDYCKFKDVVKSELNERYFFQSYETEDGFNPFYSKIRDTKTTLIAENDIHYPNWNKGVSIDISPLFNVCNNKFLESMHILLVCITYSFYLGRDYLLRKDDNSFNLHKIMRFLSIIPYGFLRIFMPNNKIISLTEKAANITKNTTSKKVSNYLPLFTPVTYKRSVYPISMISDLIEHKFYDTCMYIPKDYDTVLSIPYANWRNPVKEASIHSIVSIKIDDDVL